MSKNQSIIFDKYVEILLLRKLLNKGEINKATYNKVRKQVKYICEKEEVA